MKIGFDAKRAFFNARGLGSYSRSLIRGLSVHFPQHEYHAYAPMSRKPQVWSTDGWPGQPHLKSGVLSPLWRTFSLGGDLEKDGIEVYHGLSNEIPLLPGARQTRYVVTVHDLIFRHFPTDYPLPDRLIYQAKTGYALKHADRIITPSKASRDEVVNFKPDIEEKVKVITPICDDIFYEVTTEKQLRLYQEEMLLPGQFLLYVGALNGNKNVSTLLQALTRATDHFLVIVGDGPQRKALMRQAEQLALGDRIIFLYEQNTPNPQQLAMLYQLAFATVLPSFHEGFGLPVIESLASKTPVICSSTPALIEAIGPGGLLFTPHEADDLVDALQTLSNNSDDYQQFSMKGYEHVQQFRSALRCRELMACYEQVANY